MQTESKSRLHPLVATAAVAVIVLAGVGIAAFTGVLPSSHGSPAPAEPAAAPVAAQAPAHRTETTRRIATQRVARQEPTRMAGSSARPATQIAHSRPKCLDCGVIESVRMVEAKGQGTGLGAVAGGVAGAVLGNQMGNGNGRTVMTLVGAAGGALAGNQIEKSVRTTKHWDVSVHLQNGSSRVISLATEPALRPGDHVRIVNNALVPD
ncbi:MAG TPA: glycine zipper 2TM domain-containing protein [Burkholderiales bacterium]|nr:glycine zipper 2TM domain-containing protein [Burkholderiales bacterium]